MSILQKQKLADPNLGYARDFPPADRAHRPTACASAASRVIANAGGVNPSPARAKWCAWRPV